MAGAGELPARRPAVRLRQPRPTPSFSCSSPSGSSQATGSVDLTARRISGASCPGVSARHADHNHVQIRPDDQRLSAASGTAILEAVRAIGHVPFDTESAGRAAASHGRSDRRLHPVGGHDLFPVPLAAVQIQVADLRDIARKEVAVTPAVISALRIHGPNHVAECPAGRTDTCGQTPPRSSSKRLR